jgi:hypothetical protein
MPLCPDGEPVGRAEVVAREEESGIDTELRGVLGRKRRGRRRRNEGEIDLGNSSIAAPQFCCG